MTEKREILIDEEVEAAIRQRAIGELGVDETPNNVLRRVFELPEKRSIDQTSQQETVERNTNGQSRRRKAPKADLGRLVRSGRLEEGQRLFLVDHRGLRIKDVRS